MYTRGGSRGLSCGGAGLDCGGFRQCWSHPAGLLGAEGILCRVRLRPSVACVLEQCDRLEHRGQRRVQARLPRQGQKELVARRAAVAAAGLDDAVSDPDASVTSSECDVCTDPANNRDCVLRLGEKSADDVIRYNTQVSADGFAITAPQVAALKTQMTVNGNVMSGAQHTFDEATSWFSSVRQSIKNQWAAAIRARLMANSTGDHQRVWWCETGGVDALTGVQPSNVDVPNAGAWCQTGLRAAFSCVSVHRRERSRKRFRPPRAIGRYQLIILGSSRAVVSRKTATPQ